jgi:hypothetical protein
MKLCRIKLIPLLALLMCLATLARAAQTNSLVWQAGNDRVSADIRGEALWPLLEDIAHQSGWHIFVEPGANRNASTKFKDLPVGEALRKLLGNLNYALVPQTNGPQQLYVFTTTMHAATQRVAAAPVKAGPQKHVPNELLVKLKPGANIDALAKSLGATVVGRNDQLGLYRLKFGDATVTDSALASLKTNSDVAAVDYNYIFNPPVTPQPLANAPVGPVSLALNPPGASGRLIVGLVDTAMQTPSADLSKFLLQQISIAGDANLSSTDPTHAYGMFQTIVQGMAAQGGSTSAQILAVDIYGNSETTTSWNLMQGLQAAVNGGANIINLSLGGTTDSPMLNDFVNQVLAKGVIIFAATGNNGANTVDFPAADPGVIAVAAKQGSQLAPYSNFGSGTDIALPGTSVVYLGNQAWVVQGTSPATAYATGIAAGTKSGSSLTWAQILAAMQQKFPVPPPPNGH